ncbi:LysR family transcriptional regulator [Alcaligenaceae bacterium B3P038]|nr:LysR family transcriptional regulator [Alcaligenaceae bacterium B3P038]
MNLSLRHMKAFTALADLRSFTRAAEHCCLTQSAFSALISNLESDLGLKLFSRNTRNVELTAEGEAFQQVVAHLLPEIERGLAEMRDYVERRKGRVALAAIPSISSGILPGLLARFTCDFPGISVEVHDVASTVCVDMVRNRQVDFALCAAVSPSAELDIEVLARDTFYLICPHTHPLATRSSLEVQELLAYPVIAFERNSSIRQHLDAAIYPRQWLRSYEVNSLSTAAGLVAAGLGVAIAPTLALFQFRLAGLHAIPVSLPINERDICLARRSDATDSLATQALLTLLRMHFKDAVEAMAPVGAFKR